MQGILDLCELAQAEALRKPTALKAGDLVSLVAPSGRYDESRLDRGMALLGSWGLRVEAPPPAPALRYLAAADAERGEQLGRVFERPEVAAVLTARGGYGAARLLERLDLSIVRANPKLFVGFSDVSVLLTRFVQEAGMLCFHGPMAAADLPRLSPLGLERFRRFLFGERGWWDGSVRQCWRSGMAEGRLVGGCLSVLVTTLGTPYEIDTDQCILFLEDVAEKPYRIDRMLVHMKHAGKLERLRGLVLGPMMDCDEGAGVDLLREITMDVLAGTSFPILYGLDAGHGSQNVVLPMGCRVRLDGAGPGLELREAVFS